MKNMELEKWTTRQEAAVSLGVTTRTIDRMIKDCRLQSKKINGVVFITLASLKKAEK